MFTLISVISINTREFMANVLLALLLYDEFRNIKQKIIIVQLQHRLLYIFISRKYLEIHLILSKQHENIVAYLSLSARGTTKSNMLTQLKVIH